MTLGKAIKDVEVAVSKGDVSEIDYSISTLLSFRSPEIIGPLLQCLRDDLQHEEGMYSIIHAAESFDDDVYVEKMIECLPELVGMSPAWASVVLMRVLNSDSSRSALVRQIRLASKEARETLLCLITEIDRQNPAISAKTTAPLLSLRAAERR